MTGRIVKVMATPRTARWSLLTIGNVEGYEGGGPVGGVSVVDMAGYRLSLASAVNRGI